MNELIEVENEIRQPERNTSYSSYGLTYVGKSRVECLDTYFDLQNKLRRLYPKTAADLNERTRALLQTLYREREKNGFQEQLLFGIGTMSSSGSTDLLIQRIENYLKSQ